MRKLRTTTYPLDRKGKERLYILRSNIYFFLPCENIEYLSTFSFVVKFSNKYRNFHFERKFILSKISL